MPTFFLADALPAGGMSPRQYATKYVEDVGVGEVVVSGDKIVLRSIALGSCIGLTSYDITRKVGGMAHIMLPGRAPGNAVEKRRYAADAIEDMLSRMVQMGCSLGDIKACLVGAANVLAREDDTICQSNIDSVTRILEKRGIDICACALGGLFRKSVSIDLETGEVRYSEGGGKEKLLWRATEAERVS